MTTKHGIDIARSEMLLVSVEFFSDYSRLSLVTGTGRKVEFTVPKEHAEAIKSEVGKRVSVTFSELDEQPSTAPLVT